MSSDKNLKAADAFDYGGKTYDQDCAAGYAGKDAELAEGNAVAEDADQPCCQKPCAAGAEGDACPFAQHDIDAVSVYYSIHTRVPGLVTDIRNPFRNS